MELNNNTFVSINFYNKDGPVDLFETLPNEILLKIFLEVANKRTSTLSRVECSGLKSLRGLSKRVQIVTKTARRMWISNQAVSLKKIGCANAQEAIDYVVNNQLRSANLEDFPDIHDGHINELIDKCPNLSRLLIKSDMFFGQTRELFKSMEFGKLKELKELRIESKWIFKLDLSHNEMLEEVCLKSCRRLVYLTLPSSAPNLRSATCDDCYLLESFKLPDQAPSLEYVTCVFCHNLSSLSLPSEIPKLKQIWTPSCVNFLSLAFPEKAPCLKTIWMPNCSWLSTVKMPVDAPSLEVIEISANNLTTIIFPEIAPSLHTITCADSRTLARVVMPVEAPKLNKCNFRNCPRLEPENIIGNEKSLGGMREDYDFQDYLF